MQIYEVTDARFRKYGKVIRNIDFSALTGAMKKTPVSGAVNSGVRSTSGGKGDRESLLWRTPDPDRVL